MDTQPKMIFLYLDLVNSTEFKYSGGKERWMALFHSFYYDFPHYLSRHHDRICQKYGLQLAPLEYWKGLGDAQIYHCEYRDETEAYCYSLIFYATITEYGEYLKQKYGLQVKACAWKATFAQINLRVETPAGLDCIGPDMDLGFRLAQETLAGSFFLAMDLAYEVSLSELGKDMHFHHLGWRKLKGIHRNIPYPIILFSSPDIEPAVPIWERALSDLLSAYYKHDPIEPVHLRELIDHYKKDLHFKPEVV